MRFFTQKKALPLFISAVSVLPALVCAAPCAVSDKDLSANNITCDTTNNDFKTINVTGTSETKVTLTNSSIVNAPQGVGNNSNIGTVVVGGGESTLEVNGNFEVNQLLAYPEGKSAIEIANGGSFVVNGELTVDVSPLTASKDTLNAHGLLVKDSGSKATVQGDTSIATLGNYGKGVVAENKGSIEFKGDLYVAGIEGDASVGKFSDGVSALSGGKIDFAAGTTYKTDTKIKDGGALEGDDAAGAFAKDGGVINFYNVKIGTLGNTTSNPPPRNDVSLYHGAHGLFAKDFGVINVFGKAEVTTGREGATDKGEGADGVRVEGGAQVLLDGVSAKITTHGANASGVFADDYGKFKAINKLEITTTGKNSNAVRARNNGYVFLDSFNTTINTKGENAAGLYVLDYGKIVLGEDSQTTINTAGKTADGVKIEGNNGIVENKGTLYINVADKSSAAINLAGNNAIFNANYNGSSSYGVTIIDNTVGTAIRFGEFTNQTASLSYAMASLAAGNVQALISANGTGTGVDGDVLHLNLASNFDATESGLLVDATKLTGDFTLKATENTILTGSVKNGANGNVNFDLDSSTWNMLKSTEIHDLNATNGSTINIGRTSTGVYNTLTITGDLNGDSTGATFDDMHSDIVASYNGGGTPEPDKTNLIIVTGNAKGSYKLGFNDNTSLTTTGKEVVTVVQVGGTSADATFSLDHPLDFGGLMYELRKDGKNWELFHNSRKSTTADAAGNFLNVGYLLTYIDTQTLMQRMGELRNLHGAPDEEDGNMWMRGFAGKTNSFSGRQLDGFDMSYDGYQFGIDKLIPQPGGKFYLGVMGGYTHAKPDYRGGSGTVKDYHGGVYGTYIDDGGFYWDALAKYVYMKNNFSVTDAAGMKVAGDTSARGYTASFEAGKKYFIKERSVYGRAKFYVEPQAQFSYSMMGNGTTHASNGLRIKLTSYDSLLGRASVIAGFQAIDRVDPLDVYVKIGYVREFLGQTSFKLNNTKYKHDFGGGWFDMAVGVNAQFNSRHNIYGELSYANGNRFDKQQINFGYRYTF